MQQRIDFTNHGFNVLVQPRDTHVTEPAEVVRLSAQNQRVLARLQQGPASRVELQWL